MAFWSEARKPVKLIRDAGGGGAYNLGELAGQDEHVSLVKRSRQAGVSLSKTRNPGIRGRVVLVLDHSGSMSHEYGSGTVQTLTERALAFGLQLDSDGAIEVIVFDDKLYPMVHVTTENYRGVVDRELRRERMGSTVMSAPLKAIKKMAENSDELIFVIVIGDGSPDWNDVAATTQVACELADFAVVVKFVAVKEVEYLATLDGLGDDKRRLDNVSAVTVYDPAGISDAAFFDLMTQEVDGIIDRQLAAGILEI